MMYTMDTRWMYTTSYAQQYNTMNMVRSYIMWEMSEFVLPQSIH